MPKRGLCAFDNKRYILPDGISTLAYGHKEIEITVEVDPVIQANRESIISLIEARRRGLLWARRKAPLSHLGYDPTAPQSEGEEDAVAAGQEMRARARVRLTQVPDLPDSYDPRDAAAAPRRAPSTTPSEDEPPAKRARVRFASDASQDSVDSDPLIPTQHQPNYNTQLAMHMIFGDPMPLAQRISTLRILPRETGPSTATSSSNTRETGPSNTSASAPTRRIASSDEEDTPVWQPLPLGAVRLGRGGGRRRGRSARARRARSNAFILSETAEGSDTDGESESETPRRRASNSSTSTRSSRAPVTKKKKKTSFADHASSADHSNSDADSRSAASSDNHSDDSFVVADDFFE